MTADGRFVLDEHVNRVFERVLGERGYHVEQAKDRFGEHTDDRELLRWCDENDVILISNNVAHFESLHRDEDHAGILLYVDQNLPDDDPEGTARAVENVVEQYGPAELANEVVYLGDWYDWLERR